MDPRRELSYINQNLDEYSYSVGEWVYWAAFDPDHSVMNTVYDEAGDRAYFTPIRVQTLWINKVEAGKRFQGGGAERYDVYDHLTAAVSLNAIRNFGIPVPTDDFKRIYDVLKYRNLYWGIDDWEYIGRLAHDDVVIGIRAQQIQPSADFPFEPDEAILT